MAQKKCKCGQSFFVDYQDGKERFNFMHQGRAYPIYLCPACRVELADGSSKVALVKQGLADRVFSALLSLPCSEFDSKKISSTNVISTTIK